MEKTLKYLYNFQLIKPTNFKQKGEMPILQENAYKQRIFNDFAFHILSHSLL